MPNESREQAGGGIRKVSKACERCRALKVKCSGVQPCNRCSRGKHSCIFSTSSKRISISESYLRHLERQIQSASSSVAISGHTPGINSSQTHEDVEQDDPNLLDVLEVPLGATEASDPPNASSALSSDRPPSIGHARDDTSGLQQLQGSNNRNDHLKTSHSSIRLPRAPSPEGSEGSSFRQNPLADNDYTFAQISGRFFYMGPSSSWSFCRRVFALLGKRLPESSYRSDPGYLDGGAFRLRWRPVASDESPDVTNLPPLDFALFLFNTAKFYLGTIFYVLDEQEFIKNMHELYENPESKANSSRHWYAQYLLMLAYGKAFVVHQATEDGPPGHQYAARAMSLMPDLAGLAPNAVHAVQALILGSLYLQSIDMRVGCLQHISHALRICIIEGWHRHMPFEVVGSNYSRRCNTVFWMVHMLDREFGPLIGAPSSIRDEDITAKQPSDIDDSLEAKNLCLHVRLSRLMAQILTDIYGVGKNFDGTLIKNTQDVLRDLAHLSKDIHGLFDTQSHGAIPKTSRMGLRLILGYHHCIVLTTRPLVMCALHMHMRQTDAYEASQIMLSQPVHSLLQSCVDSAQNILRILRIVGDEDLLEAFLPFQVEDAFSSAFILQLIRAIYPSLVQDNAWKDNIQCVLDKMISKGSVVAPLRKAELDQLDHFMNALTPLSDVLFAPMEEPGQQEAETYLEEVDQTGWDSFLAEEGMGLSPQHMLDLAAQLGFEQDFVP